jgi:hypothetical protein
MDFLACPDLPILEVLQDVDLPGSLGGIFEPAVPIAVIGKPILPWTGIEDLIPRF